MAAFWLGTWKLAQHEPATHNSSQPIVADGASLLAIEVLRDGNRYAILISAADRLDDPKTLRCRIGFANGAQECCLWRSRGFPVVDAAIREHDGWLQASSAFFSEDGSDMRYGELLFAIKGVRFTPSDGPGLALAAGYEQFQEAPEPGKSATSVLRQGVQWDMGRSRASKLDVQPVEISAIAARVPSLHPLGQGPLPIANAWSGLCEVPPRPNLSAGAPASMNRSDLFGAAAFEFRQIEALEFRIDLGQKNLEELIAPLNFHTLDGPLPEFRFRVVRPVILVQLLRYGRMTLAGDQQPPRAAGDFQSQHELLIRLEVGKVDDGETQMRDPAIHVPAIFVDNPWSKILGRDLQGFEKCLADFCVGAGHLRLRPDGRLAPGNLPSPLTDIARIGLVDLVSNEAGSASPPMLEIRYDELDDLHTTQPVPPAWALADFSPDAAETDGGQAPLANGTDQFDSIQWAPVDDRPLGKSWIAATCALRDRANVHLPSATAHLTFHALDSAPRGWRTLCKLLVATAHHPATVSVQPWDWYRAVFSMDLTGRDE